MIGSSRSGLGNVRTARNLDEAPVGTFGPWPGFGVAAPPAVAAASAVGTAGTAARSDHTHAGVTSVNGAQGVVIVTAFPGFGLAPPAIAGAGAAGAAATASRSDHTHALDIVAYPPSLAGMQASGVIQQTYGAPTATPSVLTMAAGQIPYGSASGTLTQDANISWSAANRAQTIVGRDIAGGFTASVDFVFNHPNSSTANRRYSTILFQKNATTLAYLYGGGQLAGGTQPGGNLVVAFPAVTGATSHYFAVQAPSGDYPFYVDALGGDVALGLGFALATNATTGFVHYTPVAGVPTGTPAFGAPGPSGLRIPTAIDSVNGRFYAYNGGAWHFNSFDDYSATATRLPFGGPTPGTLVDSANLTYTVGTGVLQSPLVYTNTVSGFGGGGTLTLQNNDASPVTVLNLQPGAVASLTGELVPSANVTYSLGSSAAAWLTAWVGTVSRNGSNGTLSFAAASGAGSMTAQTSSTATFRIEHAGGVGGSPRWESGNAGLSFFGNALAAQQTGGSATAGGTYGATEQTMLQTAYNCLRTFGLLT